MLGMHTNTQKNKLKSYQRGSKVPIRMSLISVFLEHVYTTPHRVAILTSDTSWTYQELFDDVLLWANRVKALSAVHTPIMLCLHRTPRMLSILLALQWLEIAYIPIDPETPFKRICAIREDSKATLLFHDTVNHKTYATLPCNVWALNDLEQAGCSDEFTRLQNKPSSEAIAYVIYTSGSTGTPKGVSVSRTALDNFLTSMSHYFLNETQEMVLATTTFTFDIAALELFLPIWQHKTLFLANETEHKDPLCIITLLQKHPITLLQGTPSFWSMLYASGWQGKYNLVALCGGEPLTPQIADYVLPHVLSLWNMYGPTEATIWCSLKQITSDKNINVGKPIHNIEMHVLDASMNPVPTGIKGELYISGLGLAEGYINQLDLTQEKFIAYPSAQGERLYRTGDVACMTDEGEFIIYGRIDNQIKLHGYRIELEDIEAHIQSCSGVHCCAVVVHQEQLIAYICIANKKTYSEDAVKMRLSRELPEFMLPKRFVYLEKLPLNSSGKLNRKALVEPHQALHHEHTHVTCMQASLLNIWCEALGMSEMSIDDNFFELGGHSLLAVRIIVNVKQMLGKDVGILDLYQAPSILEFSERVHAAPDFKNTLIPQEKIKASSWMPLTDFQFVLWISHLFDANVKKLNVVGRRRISGVLNQHALNLALQAIVQKHDILSYAIHSFLPIQKKQSRQAIVWDEHILLDEEDDCIEAYLDQSMQDLYTYQAWSNSKSFLRAKLFKLTHQRIELQLAMPHLVADQQSLDILFRDLSDAYLFYLREPTADIRLESHAFESYLHYQDHAVCASLETDETFWKQYLSDAQLLSLPNQYRLSDVDKSGYCYSSFFEIDEKILLAWRHFCVAHAVTLNDLLCASVGLALKHCCQDDINMPKRLFINSVKSTREDPCYDDVIGCFLRAQPIKLDLSVEKNIVDLAKQVQKSTLETSIHQYCSSLVKLAAIGDLNCSQKSIKPFFISIIEMFFCKMKKQPYYLSSPILKAYKRLAKLDRKRGFVVNVNIWNNFFSEHDQNPSQLFGVNCHPIYSEQKDIFNIDDVLDVCLFKDREKNTSFLVLSANIKPDFREHLGRTLLSFVHE